MNLSNMLNENTTLLDLTVNSKEECMEKMAAALAAAGFVSDLDQYLHAVKRREETGTTGIGFGVAIPHGKSAAVKAPGLAFARLAQPVDWQAMDGQPVTSVFMIAVPEQQVGNEHLQILIAISRKLMHEDFRQKLHTVASAEELVNLLQNL
ncbi:PTS sugar transporter subunit IIA [Carboxydocella sp. JDF658]|uniref:PTS sugar transporter subunit IIA n=1 Tax=Carboxydocella sp. JDF658 TaxID=1926600 RepID=UPI0009ADD601|nr:fructose PTS transporter subunit IIA [Carboxydocella sp. JDF658]GAW30259.1 PTS fructose transporter subunit IIA [Carboxydocella sp. JDF658]